MTAIKRRCFDAAAILIAGFAALSGCLHPRTAPLPRHDTGHYGQVATQIEYPDMPSPDYNELIGSGGPATVGESDQVDYEDLSLQQALQLALTHSKVMLDLGGTVLRAPESARTALGPAIQETDPEFGPEAVLSAFDAQFASSLTFEKNDRMFNNLLIGDQGQYQQDFDTFQAQITKRSATGGTWAVREYTDFNFDNNINRFPGGAWDTWLEGEIRQPLLQGAGVEFNRIAGPSTFNAAAGIGSAPGVYNGVVIARLKTDISLTDFEIGVRDLVSNVENAYWDLYFAYRDLDAKIRARDAALDTWRSIRAKAESGAKGGEADRESLAREHYFRFQRDVENALAGRPLEGTRTYNGSSPGTFRGLPGVLAAERRLRLLMGVPAQERRGGRLAVFRPQDEPSVTRVCLEWWNVAADALFRREELRRQRWVIKGREMELIASKNFLLPSLDLVGRYRWRGFGDDLIDPDRENKPRFDNAFMDLTSGRFQEWQMGAEFSLPIGFRQAHAGVRNAELRLAQARCILREQERQVVHDLSGAVAELDRAYVVLQTDLSRLVAAKDQFDVLDNLYRTGQPFDFYVLLDSQRRYAEAESQYYQSRVEYALAVRNVYYEQGALLDYCGITLSEGPWPRKAYTDAARRERLRGDPMTIDYRIHRPPVVSRGPMADQVAPFYRGEPCPAPNSPAGPRPPDTSSDAAGEDKANVSSK